MLKPSLHRGGILSLPPVYRLKTIREAGDAFAHAQTVARLGAGTMVWARRFHAVDIAVILEPDDPLARSRLAFPSAMNATADALSAFAPPDKAVAFEWPATILVDGALVGGGRLAVPFEASEDAVPPWMVFGVCLRTSSPPGEELGHWRRGTTLEAEAFEEFSADAFIESFSRYLLLAMDEFEQTGPEPGIRRYLTRVQENGEVPAMGAELKNRIGDALRHTNLSSPSWRDPETGEPWK